MFGTSQYFNPEITVKAQNTKTIGQIHTSTTVN